MDRTTIERIDYVFFLIKKEDVKYTEYFLEEAIKANNVNISLDELRRILSQLQKDEYIIRNPSHAGFAHDTFELTIEGALFDGYVIEKNINDAESLRLEAIESEATANRNLTTRLTILIAVGTGIAALYYLYLLWQDACWCEFVWQHR